MTMMFVIGGSMAAAPAPPAHAAAAAPPTSEKVSMVSFTFSPATITIQAGGTVTWTYDEKPTSFPPGCEFPALQSPSPATCPGHSTTSATVGPDGKPLWDSSVHRAAGFPFAHRFNTPGTYHYFCVVHGGPHPNNPVTHMNGDIVVVASASASATQTPQPATATSTAASASPASSKAATASRSLPVTGRGIPLLWAAVIVLAGLAGAELKRQIRPE
jgi:plastocyanin